MPRSPRIWSKKSSKSTKSEEIFRLLFWRSNSFKNTPFNLFSKCVLRDGLTWLALPLFAWHVTGQRSRRRAINPSKSTKPLPDGSIAALLLNRLLFVLLSSFLICDYEGEINKWTLLGCVANSTFLVISESFSLSLRGANVALWPPIILPNLAGLFCPEATLCVGCTTMARSTMRIYYN